jgi:hypothetical protein
MPAVVHLVEVPIGTMPRSHLLLHSSAAWSLGCTFTSLYIQPDSQASFVAFPPSKWVEEEHLSSRSHDDVDTAAFGKGRSIRLPGKFSDRPMLGFAIPDIP